MVLGVGGVRSGGGYHWGGRGGVWGSGDTWKAYNIYFNECRNAALRNVATNICWTALKGATVTPQITQCGYLGVKTTRNGTSCASGLANWSSGGAGLWREGAGHDAGWGHRGRVYGQQGALVQIAMCRPQTATSGGGWPQEMVPGLQRAAGITAVMEVRQTAVSSRRGKASTSRSSGRSPRRSSMWKFPRGRLGASATRWCRCS